MLAPFLTHTVEEFPSNSPSEGTVLADLPPKESDFLYSLYLMLRQAPLSKHGRYRTFEAAAVDLRPWHIDAISLSALEHLVTERVTKRLKRGHRMARKARGEQLFGEGAPILTKAVMLDFFFENDCVTLVTSQENATDGIDHWSAQIPVPTVRLKGGSHSPYATRADIAWAEVELREHLASRRLSGD
jgi:hypothetical protein